MAAIARSLSGLLFIFAQQRDFGFNPAS